MTERQARRTLAKVEARIQALEARHEKADGEALQTLRLLREQLLEVSKAKQNIIDCTRNVLVQDNVVLMYALFEGATSNVRQLYDVAAIISNTITKLPSIAPLAIALSPVKRRQPAVRATAPVAGPPPSPYGLKRTPAAAPRAVGGFGQPLLRPAPAAPDIAPQLDAPIAVVGNLGELFVPDGVIKRTHQRIIVSTDQMTQNMILNSIAQYRTALEDGNRRRAQRNARWYAQLFHWLGLDVHYSSFGDTARIAISVLRGDATTATALLRALIGPTHAAVFAALAAGLPTVVRARFESSAPPPKSTPQPTTTNNGGGNDEVRQSIAIAATLLVPQIALAIFEQRESVLAWAQSRYLIEVWSDFLRWFYHAPVNFYHWLRSLRTAAYWHDLKRRLFSSDAAAAAVPSEAARRRVHSVAARRRKVVAAGAVAALPVLGRTTIFTTAGADLGVGANLVGKKTVVDCIITFYGYAKYVAELAVYADALTDIVYRAGGFRVANPPQPALPPGAAARPEFPASTDGAVNYFDVYCYYDLIAKTTDVLADVLSLFAHTVLRPSAAQDAIELDVVDWANAMALLKTKSASVQRALGRYSRYLTSVLVPYVGAREVEAVRDAATLDDFDALLRYVACARLLLAYASTLHVILESDRLELQAIYQSAHITPGAVGAAFALRDSLRAHRVAEQQQRNPRRALPKAPASPVFLVASSQPPGV